MLIQKKLGLEMILTKCMLMIGDGMCNQLLSRKPVSFLLF